MGCNCKASKIGENARKLSSDYSNSEKLGNIKAFLTAIFAALLFIVIGLPCLIIAIIKSVIFGKREIKISRLIRTFSVNGR